MPREPYDSIVYWAGDLERLAQNLARESAEWFAPDRSGNLSREAESAEGMRRNNMLWRNAVEAGVVLFELCGLGAFDAQPRIKNLIGQVKAELVESIKNHKVPFAHMVLNVPYHSATGRSYDVYFAKMFEGFLKVWPKDYEDQRAFDIYYGDETVKAALHVKLMRSLACSLKSQTK